MEIMALTAKQTNSPWGGLPYYPISQFYRSLFGCKVYKVPVSVAQTCPNREGIKGMQTCNFCDEWGSAAYPEIRHHSLEEQVARTMENMRLNYRAQKFLVYFQAYTNTFSKSQQLRQQFAEAFAFPDVVGAVVGTRPDCISDAVMDLWYEASQTHFMAVELGVQSFDNKQLEWMRRGHLVDKTFQAVERISRSNPQINLGIHLMFGWPDETDEDIIEAAQLTNSLPIHNVKLHNLHVLKNTPLAEDYLAGRFKPIELEDYSRRVMLFLQHLNPRIAVHRLAALSRRSEELLAPRWTAKKMEIYQGLLDYLREHGAYQGQKFADSRLAKIPAGE